jgi:taurine dioxygenase
MPTVRPVRAALGAEVQDVDLSREIEERTFQHIVEALHEFEVIFFRGQELTPEQHIAFSRRFGELEHHVRQDVCRPGYPEIFVVSNVIENGKPIGSQDAGFFWHSDLCYAEKPSRGSLFYAREVPMKDGQPLGDTIFSSMTKAYESLPEETKKKILGRNAVNSYIHGYSRDRKSGTRKPLTEEQKRKTPDREHPAVRTHPYNGKKCLFVNEGYTTRIVGPDEAESDAILSELYAHIQRPELTYRHKWRVGDFLIWDNCAVQHKAVLDYELPLRRRMERTTLTGTVPFL